MQKNVKHQCVDALSLEEQTWTFDDDNTVALRCVKIPAKPMNVILLH